MNIYEMYYANDLQFGFWVVRDSWGNTIAKIIDIKGVIEGKEIFGPKPYHENPIVTAEFYHQTRRADCHLGNLESIGELSCPGTYAYSMLE